MLADAMARHYAAHVAAYGHTLFVPKFHYMRHIPTQLATFGFLIACFVHERKHNRETMGSPAGNMQQREVRSDSDRRMHNGTHAFIERAVVEAVFARHRASKSESGGRTAGAWFRIG